MKLDIENRHLKIIHEVLSKYPYKFYAFGSRVRGNAKKLSDLDICYFEDISLKELLLIEDAFEESDLPFKVDVVAWKSMDKTFQDLIKKDLVLINV